MKNKFVQRLLQKEDPSVYQLKDGNLDTTLTTLALIGLGTGMVVGTAIFTLPGIVAADHTGPAVPLAVIVAAVGGGLWEVSLAAQTLVFIFGVRAIELRGR